MTQSNKYQEAELLDGLRAAAAALGEPLTVGRYDAYRETHPGLASRIWLIRYFRTWVEACTRAGIAVNKTHSASSRWTDEEMLSYVAAYLAEPASTGAYAGYEAWAKQIEDAPSGPSLRARFGKWSAVKGLAGELAD